MEYGFQGLWSRMSVLLLILWKLVVLSFFLVRATAKTSFPSIEYDALNDFFTSLDGSSWYWKQPYSQYGVPWSFRGANVTNPCTEGWQGVSCSCLNSTTAIEYHVASLILHSMDLLGTIPASLANLTMLMTIDLSTNYDVTGKHRLHRVSPDSQWWMTSCRNYSTEYGNINMAEQNWSQQQHHHWHHSLHVGQLHSTKQHTSEAEWTDWIHPNCFSNVAKLDIPNSGL